MELINIAAEEAKNCVRWQTEMWATIGPLRGPLETKTTDWLKLTTGFLRGLSCS